MLIDLNDFEHKTLNYDVCIIGSGIAGSIISKELSEKNKSLKVCILESGNFIENNKLDFKNISCKELKIEKQSREFMIGGTSNTWGGVSTHYTKKEFYSLKNSKIKWPIEYKELVKYWRIASEKYSFFNTYDYKDNINLFNSFDKRYFFANQPPFNFKEFIDTQNHDLIFNAIVTSLKQSRKRIEYVVATSFNKKKVEIYADKFILACGTLESIRFLLNNLKNKKLKLGLEKENIGLYFMSHPKCIAGKIKLKNYNKKLNHFIPNKTQYGSGYWGLSLPLNADNQNYLNSYVRFSYDKPILYNYLIKPFLKRIFLTIINIFLSKEKKFSLILMPLQLLDQDYNSYHHANNNKIKKIYNPIVKICFYLNQFIIFFRKLFLRKDLKIHNYLEMIPNKKNKVYLNSNKDAFGNYLLSVDYKLSEEDLDTINKLHDNLKDFFFKEDLGIMDSFRFEEIPNHIYRGSSHHIGGLIMGLKDENSVVDKNLKIHSLDNLYLISGGVLPTSGSGNPSWTIGALSIRLAEKILSKS